MPAPGPEPARLAERFALALPERLARGAAGERLGRGTGSSLEFQDHREYAPGDDLRHLDWRAFARTEKLLVRRHVEELRPRCEVLLDASASMECDPAKAALALELAALLALAARRDGTPARVVLLGDAPAHCDAAELEGAGASFASVLPLDESARRAAELLRAGALRYVVSDFLGPYDPRALVAVLARGAGRLTLLQVLSGEDAAPAPGRALRLVDSEDGSVLDLTLDARAIERYLARLRRLTAALATQARRTGGKLLTLAAGPPLEAHCRERLLPEGVLVPR